MCGGEGLYPRSCTCSHCGKRKDRFGQGSFLVLCFQTGSEWIVQAHLDPVVFVPCSLSVKIAGQGSLLYLEAPGLATVFATGQKLPS